MNTCILWGQVVKSPEFRYTPNNLAIAEMLIKFPALQDDKSPGVIKASMFGDRAKDLPELCPLNSQVILEGSLRMQMVEVSEGFKEKRAELRLSRVHPLGITGPAGQSVAPSAPEHPAPAAIAPVAAQPVPVAPVAIAASDSDWEDIPF